MPRYVLIGALGLALSGCGGSGIPADPNLAPIDEVGTAILQGNDLARFIEIQDQGYSYDQNSIFLAETLIYNRAQESVDLEVRTHFKNAQGYTLTTTPWKKITINAGQRHIYVAPSPQSGNQSLCHPNTQTPHQDVIHWIICLSMDRKPGYCARPLDSSGGPGWR
jgi:hypothetical protein